MISVSKLSKLLTEVAVLTEHVKGMTVVVNRLAKNTVAAPTMESDELLEVFPLKSEADFDVVEEKMTDPDFAENMVIHF